MMTLNTCDSDSDNDSDSNNFDIISIMISRYPLWKYTKNSSCDISSDITFLCNCEKCKIGNKYSTYILTKDTQEKTLKREIFFTKKLTNTLCSHLLVAIYFTFILLEIKEWRPAVWFSDYENLIYKNLEKNILELGEKEKPFLKIDQYSEKNRETIISVKEYLSEINLTFN